MSLYPLTISLDFAKADFILKTMAGLSKRQLDFIDNYVLTNDRKKAAVSAGYSLNGLDVQVHRLLKNAKIVDEIEKRRVEIRRQKGFTKDVFIEYALQDYKTVEPSSANRPRFLQLAGQASGIIGPDQSSGNTLNISLTKNTLNVTNNTVEMLEGLHKMLEAE